MKSNLLYCIFFLACTTASAQLIDFDDASKWTSGSGSIGSYQSDHKYEDQDWEFTGGPALRETSGTQNGHPKTNSGANAWRLRDVSSVIWTATLTTCGTIEDFGFAVRRWDGSPSPDYDVSFSTNGGSSYTSIETIDNTFLGNSSAYSFVSHTIGSPTYTEANDFIVKVEANSAGERIMIDDFTFTKEFVVAVNPSGVTHTPYNGTSTTISWTNPGSFTNIVVIGSTSAAVMMSPDDCTDPTSWTASADYSAATEASTYVPGTPSGERVLYVGSGTSVTVNGLSGSTLFYSVFNQLNPWSSGASGSAPLPVSWLSFEGRNTTDQTYLTWSTASEIDNSHFEVMKSYNNTDFMPIGKVTGAGNSYTTNNYSFTDNEFNNRNTYYKIKQIDFNGDFNFSKVIYVKGEIGEFEIYPNPSFGELNFEAKNEINLIEIFDIAGKLIIRQEMFNEKNGAINLNVQQGIYLAKIHFDNGIIATHKIIIK